MKIISKPSTQFTCRCCKTVAEYDAYDIQSEVDSHHRDKAETVYYILCPTCKHRTDISVTAHQKAVMALITKRKSDTNQWD